MSILEEIRSPSDVRKLPESSLDVLAGEIRQTILETTARNGGHLASNLGMVEATIALHRTFRCPEDAFVFDVGHQAYAHKLLTGRYGRFTSLRQAGGLSGFTNREESPFDTTTAGHSGPSVSTAVGIAKANARAGNERWTVAVIGDGSFTNGMVYEALNQLDDKSMRLMILLNDNEMSISRNVGGLSKYLAGIRTSEGYFTFKTVLKTAFSAIPLMGDGLVNAARAVRDFLKRLLGAETLFESLGIEYIGPVNGNDVRRLTGVLEEAKKKNCPVLVHMITKKGLGFPPAEEHPERYHSTAPFDPNLPPDAENNKKSTSRAFADEVSDALCRMAEEDERIWAITAAMKDGCGLAVFAARFPDRFSDVGIAEEQAAAMAGGLALAGRKPVLALYSTFAQRVFDQLWHDVALQRADVMLLLSHAGLVPGDGVTHQGIYDVPLLSCIPGVKIWSPDTFEAFRCALKEARPAADKADAAAAVTSADAADTVSVDPKADAASAVTSADAADTVSVDSKADAASAADAADAASAVTSADAADAVSAASNASTASSALTADALSADPGSLKIVRYPKGGEAKYGAISFTDHRTWKETLVGCARTPALTVVTYGRIAGNVCAAAEKLSRETTVRVIVLERILPLPAETDVGLAELLSGGEPKLFVEESLRSGGIGEKLAAFCAVHLPGEAGAKWTIRAVEEGFLPHGSVDFLMKKTGLDADSLAEAMRSLLKD